jgi:OmpA-OmpF porin, OOP family
VRTTAFAYPGWLDSNQFIQDLPSAFLAAAPSADNNRVAKAVPTPPLMYKLFAVKIIAFLQRYYGNIRHGTMKRALLIHTCILSYLLTLLLTAGVDAQIRIAATIGVHSANVLETNNIPGWDTAVQKYYSPRTGFQVGVLAEIPIGTKGFFLQPGIDYSSKGRKYAKYNDSSAIYATDTVYTQTVLKLGYVEIPIYLTYKIALSAHHPNSFFLSAGPYAGFFYSGIMSSQSLTFSTSQYYSGNQDLLVGKAPNAYKTLDMGINAKAGFELGSVVLSGYFSRGLSNFYTATYPGTFHHQLFGASLGIWLNKTHLPVPPIVKDTDHDGIPDDQDMCPLQPGTIAWHGCPVPDSDKDGIDDEHDSCKNTPGVARYHGCPIPDTDGDGINDEEDSCKTLPGLARYHGCPIPDRDHDGINDEEDKCPDEPGSLQNQGCPLVVPAATPKPTYQGGPVVFELSSSRLTQNSYGSLDDLAMLLKSYPTYHLTIEGYTDNTGTPSENRRLSIRRAQRVQTYLLSKGVDPNQLTIVGYGAEKPVADNRSEAGRAMNRRVEFRFE